MAKKQAKNKIQNSPEQYEVPIRKTVSKPIQNTATDDKPLNTTPFLDKVNLFLKKNITLVFCLLLLGWVGVRVSYYYTVVNSPLYNYYLLNESDNKFFDDWAKYLNTDWLNAKPYHPYHSWHKSFADAYFAKHPEKLKEIEATNVSKDTAFIPGKALWDEWYHGNQYHQEPFYPYLLAVFYHFHMNEVQTMILLQLMLGVLSGVLLFFITRKYFGETTAVLTGLLYLLCGILMYNEIVLLRTSWIVFFTMLNVVAMDRVISNRKPLDYLLCGLCFGLSFLMQSSASLFLVGVLAITLFVNRVSWPYYFKNAGLLILGFLIIFSPVIMRNLVVGAPTFSISSVGPPDIISCNVYGTESISGWTPSAQKEVELLGQAHKSLSGALIASLETYPSIGAYISLELQKLKAAWVGIEYPNNENFYFYRQYVPVLRLCCINFFWIAPLGLAGLIFCIYNRKQFYPFYLAIGIQLIILMLIFVLARFRAPLVILLLPFSAYAIVECVNMVNAWKVNKSIAFAKIATVVLLVLLSLSGYSTAIDNEEIIRINYNVVYVTYFQKKLDEYFDNKQWDKWLALQAQLIDMAPGYIKNAASGGTMTHTNQIPIMQFFGTMHKERKEVYETLHDTADAAKEGAILKSLSGLLANSVKELNLPPNSKYASDIKEANNDANLNLALSFSGSKQYDSAIIYFYKFFGGDPINVTIKQDADNLNALFTLSGIYITIRKYPQAIALLHKMLLLKPEDDNLHMKIGEAFLCNAQYDSSETHDKKALQINPKNTDAINNLAGVYFFYKKYPEALDMYKKAIELRPDFVESYTNMGACYFYLNKWDLAVSSLNKAISINSNYTPSYQILGATYRAMGKSDSAKKYDALANRR